MNHNGAIEIDNTSQLLTLKRLNKVYYKLLKCIIFSALVLGDLSKSVKSLCKSFMIISSEGLFSDEMIVSPGECGGEGDCTFDDHPLSMSPDSQWQTFFKDNEVLLQIDKDVR